MHVHCSHSSNIYIYAGLIWSIWAKMYKIRVKAIFDQYDLFGLQWCSRMFTLTVRKNIRGCMKKGLWCLMSFILKCSSNVPSFSSFLPPRQERIAARQSVVLAKGKAVLDNRQECVLNTDSYHQVPDCNSKTSIGCGFEVIFWNKKCTDWKLRFWWK